MAEWQERFDYLLAELDPGARARVVASIQNSVLSGFEPTEADVRVMVCLERGEITSLQAFADIASRRGQRAREARERGENPWISDEQVRELEALLKDEPE